MEGTKLQTTSTESIRDFIDMYKVRRYLIHYPNLLLLFEILINHIEDYIQMKALIINDTYKSSTF
jgi:hypothetical protein